MLVLFYLSSNTEFIIYCLSINFNCLNEHIVSYIIWII